MYGLQVSILFLIMCLSFGFAAAHAETPVDGSASNRSTVEEKKHELNRIQRRLKKSKRQLQQQRHKEKSVLSRLDRISRRQAVLANDVHATAQALQAAQERAEDLQVAHDRLSDRLEQQRQRLRQRVRQLYKLGQLPYAKLLLSAKDVAEFARKVQYTQK